MSQHLVELMVRTTCGSCARVREQITPVVKQAGAELAVRNVDEDAELAMEFGDRVPVVVIDGEEFACWEVDNEELAAELAG
ncbi:MULTISPECIES: glutaredoxin family protein [Corynebacterium]|jgi:glutaredoxin|uniref:Glutaredoxin family protein n=2 Tax=Corynebacterium TaxID=1716 RepID=A0A9X3MC41_9CORY|nr:MULTISPECIES: glutaredoxin family protein [Corynebacterium]ECQ5354076.1 glutaredoxin family protein [Campylobacter jejuni]MBK3428414.1 glutaredoxin family protein [Corynebacterium tuberculostearicum]MBS5996706.1 glutaredoxin family protein [Corynebacterium sp.]MCG7442199.1 glutaredoxin family protein [Corynebacterium sp. ACRPQ]MCG7455474.1 glutaredoxin family protein [Corynebacterium tuberculostearicum]